MHQVTVADPAKSEIYQSQSVEKTTYSLALSYLKAFVIFLVVAHHSFIVYMTMKPPHQNSMLSEPRYWLVFPVSDRAGFMGFDLLVGWNDIFFMPLMFLLSGVFVWPSLKRRGAGGFVKARMIRIGIPFLAMTALGPLMYLPAYLQATQNPTLAGYAQLWGSLGNWPSGPSWFLWVLLGFDCIAAACFTFIPNLLEACGQVCRSAEQKPLIFFFGIAALTTVVYLPLILTIGPYGAIMFGPFFAQGTKLPVYFLYFLVGICVGMVDLQGGLFDPNGKLARRPWLWGVVSILLFVGWIAAYSVGKDRAAALVFPFTCLATSLFAISTVVKLAAPNRMLDSFSRNSYGIYLIHYVLLSYLQYLLLPFLLPALIKGFVALISALLLSWGITAVLRKSPALASVI